MGIRKDRKARRIKKVNAYYEKLLSAMAATLERGEYKNMSEALESVKSEIGFLISCTPQETTLIEEAAIALANNINHLFETKRDCD